MGMRMLFDSVPDFEIVGEAGNALDAITAVSELHPDVVLMDIGLPDLSGIEATRRIKAGSPETAVIALTIHEDKEYFFKMLDAGASGYVPKRAAPEELITAIRAAATDDVYIYPSLATFLVKDYLHQQKQQQARTERNVDGLTPREQEVLIHLADGETNAEIGEKLTISHRTVARHRENIMQKLNLHSRTELVKYAIRRGIIRA
jgi:two-component system response regulator NreC